MNDTFFFQAEDGIRDGHVTGVQTCALPIYLLDGDSELTRLTDQNRPFLDDVSLEEPEALTITAEDGWDIQGWLLRRSEERRVGKESGYGRWRGEGAGEGRMNE